MLAEGDSVSGGEVTAGPVGSEPKSTGANAGNAAVFALDKVSKVSAGDSMTVLRADATALRFSKPLAADNAVVGVDAGNADSSCFCASVAEGAGNESTAATGSGFGAVSGSNTTISRTIGTSANGAGTGREVKCVSATVPATPWTTIDKIRLAV